MKWKAPPRLLHRAGAVIDDRLDGHLAALRQIGHDLLFEGLHGLRSILESRQVEFVATVTEKLLVYAVGRGAEYYDQPAIRAIVRDAAPEYKWSSIVQGITRSIPFQMKQGRTEQ